MHAGKLIFAQECRLIERRGESSFQRATRQKVRSRDFSFAIDPPAAESTGNRVFAAFPKGRTERGGATESGGGGRGLKGVAGYFPFKGDERYSEFISQWRHGQLGLQPDRSNPSRLLPISSPLFFFLQRDSSVRARTARFTLRRTLRITLSRTFLRGCWRGI